MRSRILVINTLFILGSLELGCSIIHTTEVQPGVHIDVEAGGGLAPAPWIADLGVGYGWKFNENIGLLLELTLPMEMPPYSLMYSGLDIYFQFLGNPLDMGIGVVGAYSPDIYLQFGKGFTSGNSRFGIDVGFEFSVLGMAYGPYLLISYKYSFFTLGLWAKAGFCVNIFCGVGGGLLFGFNFGAPEPPTGKASVPELESAPVRITASRAQVEKIGLAWVRSEPAGVDFTKTEITVAQYLECMVAGACTRPYDNEQNKSCNWGYGDRGDHPVNCVMWHQADAFCKWIGGRLPTEQEWHAEASNGIQWAYPWGDQDADCTHAVTGKDGLGCGRGSTWPVCSKPDGNSVSGLCDMSGNVWEWTASSEGSDRVLRGGSWADGYPNTLDAAYRYKLDPSKGENNIGFRCAQLGHPENAIAPASTPTSNQEVSQPPPSMEKVPVTAQPLTNAKQEQVPQPVKTERGPCAEEESTAAASVAPIASPTCPEGSEVVGAAPPKGYEQWCARKDSKGKPVRDGWYKSWFCASRIASEGEYRDGLKQGKWTYFYIDGKKRLEGEFQNEEKTGLWIFWSQDGTKEREVQFRDDVEVQAVEK